MQIEENRDWAVRIHSSRAAIGLSCFTEIRNVPASSDHPSHDISVLYVGHSEKEELHLVSVRSQEGAALDTRYVAGRI